MIARELTEFFADFAPTAAPPRMFGADDPTFLSNVNAAYRRACWEEIRFDDVALQRGPGVRARARGARRLAQGLRAGGRRAARARLPAARVHAPLLRRVPRAARDDRPRRADRRALDRARRARARRRRPALDARARARRRRLARWTGRSLVHHTGRKVFSALGSARRRAAGAACSARSRSRAARTAAPPSGARPRRPARARAARDRAPAAARARARLRGDRPRAARRAGAAARPGARDGRPRAAAHRVRDPAVPARQRRPQHHLPALLRLERRATRARSGSHDPFGERDARVAGGAARPRREYFAPVAGAGVQGLRRLVRRRRRARHRLADRVPAARAARRCARARTSSTTTSPSSTRRRPRRSAPPRRTARASTASPAARGCATCTSSATAASAGVFQYGVDHDVYRPRPIDAARRHGRLLLPRGRRRAAPCRSACMALAELHRAPPRRAHRAVRRPRPAADAVPVRAPRRSPAPSSSRGRTPRRRSGVCLSLTNYSLIPQEMLACGLPCVELEGASASSCSAPTGRSSSSPFDVAALADALERLLDDAADCERRSRGGHRVRRGAHLGPRRRAGRGGDPRGAARPRLADGLDPVERAAAERPPRRRIDRLRRPLGELGRGEHHRAELLVAAVARADVAAGALERDDVAARRAGRRSRPRAAPSRGSSPRRSVPTSRPSTSTRQSRLKLPSTQIVHSPSRGSRTESSISALAAHLQQRGVERCRGTSRAAARSRPARSSAPAAARA